MHRLAFGSILLLPCLAGCGSTCSVSGEVSYDGAAVADGMITFTPADGKGSVVGAPISNGRYAITEKLTPGSWTVSITAVKDVPFARTSEEMAQKHADAKAKGN